MKNKTVWETLSSINVNNKTEKKGNLTYLSWAWAWGELMNNYPQATYTFTEWEYPDGTFKDVLIYPDETCMVECELRIDEISHKMWLPVMDYRNQAIANPNARAISDTKMRCLVKCIAMFGLGHNIYAGEDLPQNNQSAPIKEEKAPHKKQEKKLPKAQQEQADQIKNIVTTHHVFTEGQGKSMQKQILDMLNSNPSAAQLSEWLAYVVGETSIHDNEQKDKELKSGR